MNTVCDYDTVTKALSFKTLLRNYLLSFSKRFKLFGSMFLLIYILKNDRYIKLVW